MKGSKHLDVICLGRAAVDLYGQQIGSRLEDMSSFAKYLGGSAANTAYGAARLGLKSAMLTRVGDEHMGRFVRETLALQGVDVTRVKTDPERLTGLVILGIKDEDTFPLIFYRRDCADMALSADDFSPEFIASSRALLVNGTHLSSERTLAACRQAIAYARAAETRTILDIDYRPVLWGLTGPGEGENRFVSSEAVSSHMQALLAEFDLIVGTEEEVHIAGGSTDTIAALTTIRSLTNAVIVLKRGASGCAVLDGAVPASVDDLVVHQGPGVDVLNVLGAGDAFMSGFLRGWLRDEPIESCCAYANACGALVVSRHGCAPAIPSQEELLNYIDRAGKIERPDRDPQLRQLHRIANRARTTRHDLFVLAFDHRSQFVEMTAEVGADLSRVSTLKRLLAVAVERVADEDQLHSNVGVLLDDTFAQDVLNELTGRGWWIGRPVEIPGSRPLELQGGRSIGTTLKGWPVEHVVKCLVLYHPDDESALRAAQERQLTELHDACVDSGHELLLEVVAPKNMPLDDHTMVRAMTRFYNLGVFPDWWKLPAPTREAWQKISDLLASRAPHCRGVLILGLDASVDELRGGLRASAGFGECKGFAVGRTVFGQPSRAWLRGVIDDSEFISQAAANYRQLIAYWRERTGS